jgi:[ribosomal protein S5]-alanine N-acetyltransferase
MPINSPRLVIRDFRLPDWAALHQLYMKPETVKYNPGGYPENEMITKDLVNEWAAQHELPDRKNYTMVICDNINNSFIGIISLDLGKAKYRNAEVWFKLDPGNWDRGFATESLNAVLKFGFEILNLHRIECGCSAHNAASYRVMEKAGMTREGIKRQHLPLDDEWHDAYIYAILKEEFNVKS